MSGNTFGHLFSVTTFGESHGPAIGCVVDGCPPGMLLTESDIQADLDRRKPGTSRHVTQRMESDTVEILSGLYEGKTTGTPIALLIRNEDQRSKDYSSIAQTFRPGHADYTYWQKYGIRDYRGGGRSSARETTVRVGGTLHADNGNILCAAAAEGVGIVLQPTFLAHELLRSRKLVRVLEEWTVDPLTIYAVYPDRQYLPPKVRTLIDFLVARFGARPRACRGDLPASGPHVSHRRAGLAAGPRRRPFSGQRLFHAAEHGERSRRA